MPSWSSSYVSGGLPRGTGNTFFDDTTDDSPLSPGNRPIGIDDYSYCRENRRPSIASAHTASSAGSKGSGKFHKKLNGFFGDDFPGDSRRNDNMAEHLQYTGVIEPVSAPKRTQANIRDYNGSGSSTTKGGSADGRPVSPAVGRLWTPQQGQPKPSSEVTPWEYQVCSHKCKFCMFRLFYLRQARWVNFLKKKSDVLM